MTSAEPSPSRRRSRIGTLVRAWRRRGNQHGAPLPVGPGPAGPWAGADRRDRDRDRLRADLRGARAATPATRRSAGVPGL